MMLVNPTQALHNGISAYIYQIFQPNVVQIPPHKVFGSLGHTHTLVVRFEHDNQDK